MWFKRRWSWLAIFPFALVACDSGSPAAPEGDAAVVVGSVEQTQAQGSASSSASPSLSPSGSAQAETVVIGQVQSGGSFQALAEGGVDAQGNFRIEGVPTGRSDLVIIARGQGDSEVGSTVLHAETRAGAEHRSQPINARSTLHARVFSHLQGSGQGGMSSSELALFVHTRADVAAAAAASEAQVQAIANATVRAEEALTAVLASEGTQMSAQARSAILLALATDRDQNRAAGADAEATQRAFVSAAVEAFADAGVSAEAQALAYAAATTALDHAMLQADANARLDLAKEAVLLGLEARNRVVAETQGTGLGLRAATMTSLDQLAVQVSAAASVAELRATLDAERAEREDRVVSAVLSGLDGVSLDLRTVIEGQLRTSLGQARFWAQLDGSASGQAMAEQAASFRAQVQSAAEAFVESLPSEAQADVSVEVMATLLLAMGCGPALA